MATKSLSVVAQRRIQSELNEWLRNPPEGCCLESYEPMTSWVIIMQGPEGHGRLYADEVFRIRIDFTENYPLDPPDVVFIPPVPIHPHIYSNGHICLDILYSGHNGGWSPALTMSKVVLSLRSMLASATEKKKPPGDAEYSLRVGNRSPKLSKWVFEDDKV
ncbi:hypothetical protein VOLCADRAFT_95153 [Volvox carteri f. nagariensis]|uniref:UBC core domain-containing protein n=1 Tax=Volvox carteri f. nagariensis TaxID=3068 RepID=D8U6R3_VOLCA|nr:uncharacterized protein VOLCADRAFT_95153 [Volvox carteri f. nagariensis]EFJ44486.1 hypothetical protein VOLCADRAFT_95153 [Volvox carteri f. nagariensis]|eukprot:XP_002954336.1 hypothetical protein VOLCADRAFT_95153 [Volvox carteri f. nagariensis]